jgi:hypothetical protein
VTDSLTSRLLRLSEAGPGVLLAGEIARRHPPGAIDRLLAAGVLQELAPTEEWSPCIGCDCAFGFRPIQRVGDRIVAACPIDAGADTELEEDDLRAFRIDAGWLLSLLARASGIPAAVEPIAPGLWHLGRLPSGRVIVVALPARALQAPGTVLLVKASGTTVTVVARDADQATRQRLLEAGIDLVELDAVLRPGASGIDRLRTDALEPQQAGPRLSIRLEAQTVLIDGTLQRVPSQPFNLLALLARAAKDGKGPVRNRAIEDATGRDARDLVRELRDALSAGRPNGSELRDWIAARRSLGAFELVLDREEIVVAI